MVATPVSKIDIWEAEIMDTLAAHYFARHLMSRVLITLVMNVVLKKAVFYIPLSGNRWVKFGGMELLVFLSRNGFTSLRALLTEVRFRSCYWIICRMDRFFVGPWTNIVVHSTLQCRKAQTYPYHISWNRAFFRSELSKRRPSGPEVIFVKFSQDMVVVYDHSFPGDLVWSSSFSCRVLHFSPSRTLHIHL